MQINIALETIFLNILKQTNKYSYKSVNYNLFDHHYACRIKKIRQAILMTPLYGETIVAPLELHKVSSNFNVFSK